MALNFPNNGLYEGLEYTGDNGVTYIYDGVKWIGHAVGQPAGTNSITNNGKTVQVDGDGNLVIPNNTIIKYASGAPVVTGGVSTSTRWDAVPAQEGCPIYAELTPDHFQAFTQQSNLGIRNTVRGTLVVTITALDCMALVILLRFILTTATLLLE